MTAPTPEPPTDVAAIGSSADAIVGTTLDGVITSWNRAAERLFGYAATEALGQPISPIVPHDRLADEHDVLACIRRGEALDHFETVRVAKDGQRVEVSLAISPVKAVTGEILGASSIARDVRERRRLEEARGRLAAIVDSSEDAIVSKTLDGVITSWNRGAEKLFGYPADEVIGRSILIIIPPERRTEEDEVLGRIRRGEAVEHFETVRCRKDGTRVDISLTVSPVRDRSGRIVGASKIARDIGDRKRAEQQLARLYEEAREANRAKDEFLAMLGHELRNPLGAIRSAIQLMDGVRSDGDGPAAHACDVIARQTTHLARLVDDLLDVGRVMTGKIMLDRQPTDLAEIAARTVATFTATGKAQQHRLLVDVDASAVWIEADPVRVEQIAANLVTNALKYTPAGGTIQVTVKHEGPDAILEVTDSGIGIPAHLLPHIFDLFVQGERGLDRSQGGLGIGLTLVRRLTALHGGSVDATSAGPGLGSRFTVRLPAVPPPRQGKDRLHPPVKSTEREAPRRVLLVEDNKDSRDMLHYVLERAGHEVHDAEDGTEGLDAALRLQPDVALIDVGLPGLDGYEVAKRIRAASDRPDMLLVALTGYGMAEDRRRAMTSGFNLHMVKPVNPDELLDVLQSWTARPPGL